MKQNRKPRSLSGPAENPPRSALHQPPQRADCPHRDQVRTFASDLEHRLLPIVASVVAAAGGGRDSHGQLVPGLEVDMAQMPAALQALATWARNRLSGSGVPIQA